MMESELKTQTMVAKKLREGSLPFTARTIKFANEGNKICHEALLLVCPEMMSEGGKLPGQGPGWMQIWSYGQRKLVPPHTHKYRPGVLK
jgi:hypothetical protein